MRKTVMALGLVMTVLLTGCDWGGTPPIPVVRVDDDAVDNTLTAPQVVDPELTFDQHLRLVGTVSHGPGVYDVYRIDVPVGVAFRLAFDCTASANLVVELYSDQQAFLPPARSCGPGHLTAAITGSGFHLLVGNVTTGSVEASYDLTLELVAAS